VAREGSWIVQEEEVNMGEIRRWSVEKAANVDTSEVFWDQSRAGYIRLITQRRANKHGRFLTIEEFNGSSRCGSVLIPEGWSGRGWSKTIKELREACSILKIGRGIRREKPKAIINGSRSYAEVVGDTKRVEEKGILRPEKPLGVGQIVPENETEKRERGALSIKPLSVPSSSALGTDGYDQKLQGEEAGLAHRSSVRLTMKKGDDHGKSRGSQMEVECQGSQGKVKGWLEGSFNAKQELRGFREWLWQLRSEADAGLGRIDVIIKMLEADGPGQLKNKNKKVWIPKSRLKRKPKFIKKTSGGPGPNSDGAGPSMGYKVDDLEPNPVTVETKMCAGQAFSEGLIQEPISQVQMGVEKATVLGLKKKWVSGVMAISDGPNPSGDEGTPSAGSDEGMSVVPETLLAASSNGSSERNRRELESAQRSPMGQAGNTEAQWKVPTRSVSGSGAVHGARGSVCRPESSWVAGRTGFGPVHTGEVVGSSILVVDSGKKDAISVRRSLVQTDEVTTVDKGKEVILGGKEMEAQACPLEMTAVLEVYSRREASIQSISKMQHRDSEVSSVGAEAETLLQDGTHDEGVDQLSVEKSLVEGTLEKSMEVSDIAGLSWDGQERWKEERLRSIIVDRTEKGCGGDTGITDFQQTVNSMGRFWGNCSDDEA
jgi:hypothetical protein